MKEPIAYIPFDQTSIAVRFIRPENGREEPHLVFLHHALGSIAQWKDFPRALAARTQLPVLLIDRAGHGRSGPAIRPRNLDFFHEEALEVLPFVLAELGIERPCLVGHSDGATIALLYASRFPTTAVIAEAPHIEVEEETLVGIRLALENREDLALRLQKYHGTKTEALIDAWADTWLAPWFRQWSIVPELDRIESPVLVIQGLDDPYGTNRHVEGILKALGRKACTFLLKDAGHFPHVEAREAVLEREANFIRYSITNHITPIL